MGGKASKVLQETTLVKCTAHGDDGSPVICGAPVSESIEGLKGGERCPFVLFGSGTRVQCVVGLAKAARQHLSHSCSIVTTQRQQR